MAWLRPPERDIGTGRALLGSSLALGGVLGLLLLALGLLDRLGLETAHIPRAVLAAAAGLVTLTAFLSPVRRPADWAVADREVGPVPGGLAGAVVLAGLAAIALAGAAAAALAAGTMLGAVLAAILLAPRLRRFGGYGFGDFLSARFGRAAQFAAALVGFGVSLLLLVAALMAVGPPVATAFGFTPERATWAAAALIALMVLPGGARSLAATQAMNYLLIALACLVPAALLSARSTGAGLGGEEAALLLPPLASGLGVSGAWPMVAISAAGAAALPPLLAQVHAAPSARAAALSLVWTLLFAAALFAGWLVFVFTLAEASGAAGLRTVGDLLSTDRLYRALPSVLVGLVVAGALAALVALGQAALFSAAGALSHDIWDAMLDRKAPAGRRLLMGRLFVGAVTAGAAWLAIGWPAADPPTLLVWALALAAAGGFPPLLLGIWWRRCNGVGAVLAIAAGSAVVALACAAEFSAGPAWPPVPPAMAGGIGMLAAFAAAILGSLASRAPAAERQALVAELRQGRERPPMRERPA